MKRINLVALFCLCVTTFCICGCNFLNTYKKTAGDPHESAQGIENRYTAEEDKIVDFAQNRTDGFYASHGYGNGGMFDCVWSRDSAVVKDGVMNMSLSSSNGAYYGAEYRSYSDFSYGYFSVCMKAAACSGVVSSFFTYTNRPKWDEIDIEFLGNDTAKVQFNYYTNGVGGHEYLHDLGFDASKDFHEYGFYWQSDCIVWFVDGKAIYKATKDIPSSAGKIMANVWNGKGVEDWIGVFDSSALPVTAQYRWFGYKTA